MRTGIRIGVDVGKARVGIAKSDPHGMLAVPVETAPREFALDRVVQLASDDAALEIVVGLPLNLRGEHTQSTDDAISFAELIAHRGFTVRLMDERLSTVTAQKALQSAGKRSKDQRRIIDQVAATGILQATLDAERLAGAPPGSLVLTTIEDTTRDD